MTINKDQQEKLDTIITRRDAESLRPLFQRAYPHRRHTDKELATAIFFAIWHSIVGFGTGLPAWNEQEATFNEAVLRLTTDRLNQIFPGACRISVNAYNTELPRIEIRYTNQPEDYIPRLLAIGQSYFLALGLGFSTSAPYVRYAASTIQNKPMKGEAKEIAQAHQRYNFDWFESNMLLFVTHDRQSDGSTASPKERLRAFLPYGIKDIPKGVKELNAHFANLLAEPLKLDKDETLHIDRQSADNLQAYLERFHKIRKLTGPVSTGDIIQAGHPGHDEAVGAYSPLGIFLAGVFATAIVHEGRNGEAALYNAKGPDDLLSLLSDYAPHIAKHARIEDNALVMPLPEARRLQRAATLIGSAIDKNRIKEAEELLDGLKGVIHGKNSGEGSTPPPQRKIYDARLVPLDKIIQLEGRLDSVQHSLGDRYRSQEGNYMIECLNDATAETIEYALRKLANNFAQEVQIAVGQEKHGMQKPVVVGSNARAAILGNIAELKAMKAAVSAPSEVEELLDLFTTMCPLTPEQVGALPRTNGRTVT